MNLNLRYPKNSSDNKNNFNYQQESYQDSCTQGAANRQIVEL